jgi:hypothetical protein
MTGLVCECAAACHWQTVVRESQVENVAGRVPTYLLDRILARVLELVAERAAKNAAGADELPPA